MRAQINSYIAVLCITIVGGAAALIIVDIGTTDVIASSLSGSEANYTALRQSILKNR